MDPAVVAQQPTGLYAWIMANGQMIAFFTQIIYWLGMLVLIGYAVWQYKRWVNFQLGTGKSGKRKEADATEGEKPESKGTSVDEFVE
jgi:hypothetical protein